MRQAVKRREFLQLGIIGTAVGFGLPGIAALASEKCASKLISPGCRRSKVKVARLFLGNPKGLWPKPNLDLEDEVRSYRQAMAEMEGMADVEFAVDQMVTSVEDIRALQGKLTEADGVLAIHLNIGIMPILEEILAAGRPTVVFAIPYSGHEWSSFGAVMKEPRGEMLDCMLTTDRSQLAAAIRPFRALHHLREAKVINITARPTTQYHADIRAKFGTEIKHVGLDRVVAAYEAVDDDAARAEAEWWSRNALEVVEPAAGDIFRAGKLALALEKMLDDEDATVLTVDCYGTMWDKTIKLPAYPCLGFSRLNGMGLGGICESDLRCAMTHIIFQGLAGKPGFISDPTVDEATGSIILAHCMGTVNMEGADKPAAPYKLRTILERQEGVVPQVFMKTGIRATQSLLVGTDQLLYFTGDIVDAPDVDRGCRTKITLKIDGSAERLWKNWSAGLHRVTCYGDLSKDLERFCRFAKVNLTNEAA